MVQESLQLVREENDRIQELIRFVKKGHRGDDLVVVPREEYASLMRIKDEFMDENMQVSLTDKKQKLLQSDIRDLEMENQFVKEQNQALEKEISELRDQLTRIRRQSNTRSTQGAISDELQNKCNELRAKNFEVKTQLAETS